MIRASTLRRLPVVDMEAAERIGYIEEAVLDPDARRIAGLIVSRGQPLLGGSRMLVPAAAVYAVGPDALTIRSGFDTDDARRELSALPRLAQITGRKVVSFGGKHIGSIHDVLLNRDTGEIIGYAIQRISSMPGLESLFGRRRYRLGDYVRADADLRVGSNLIVVPDNSIVREAEIEESSIVDAAETSSDTRLTWSPDPRQHPQSMVRPLPEDRLLEGAPDDWHEDRGTRPMNRPGIRRIRRDDSEELHDHAM